MADKKKDPKRVTAVWDGPPHTLDGRVLEVGDELEVWDFEIHPGRPYLKAKAKTKTKPADAEEGT